jgi:hypothetical protein
MVVRLVVVERCGITMVVVVAVVFLGVSPQRVRLVEASVRRGCQDGGVGGGGGRWWSATAMEKR